MSKIRIAPATELDLPVILDMIHALAEYEKLGHMVTATEERLRETGPARTLFGGPVREASPARQGNWVGAVEAPGEACDGTPLRQVRVGSARLEPAVHPVLQEAGCAVPLDEWTKYRLA